MQDIAFYQSHLDRVSRSFAFCIQKLPASMRLWTSLSYLLCRALDTVEDSAWGDFGLQERKYFEFESFVKGPLNKEVCLDWIQSFPNICSAAEKELIRDAFFLFEDLHQLPEDVKSAIQSSVLRMSAGMRHYSQRQEQNGVFQLADLVDLNRYCYFVAGVVGELLSRLFLSFRPDFKPDSNFHKNAFHFGLFLQKINILKDSQIDEKEERFLVPDRQLVLASLKENAAGAIEYLVAIPVDEKGYRTFCAWSLFLGLTSLPWIQEGFINRDDTKIPRAVTEALLESIEEIIDYNDQLRERFQEFETYFPAMPESSVQVQVQDSELASELERSQWFLDLCGNILDGNALAELRL